MTTPQEFSKEQQHCLNNSWRLWAHLPLDGDWSINSYKNIYTFNTVEETIVLFESIPEKMIKNCMLFLMRDGIHPIWEDPKNSSGGCFSYKISNKTVVSSWRHLVYSLVGETLTHDNKHMSIINGVTISPKKNFCIIKVWLSTCDYQNPNIIKEIKDLTLHGCLFKKHTPEY
jgi:hypothetical protein